MSFCEYGNFSVISQRLHNHGYRDIEEIYNTHNNKI